MLQAPNIWLDASPQPASPLPKLPQVGVGWGQTPKDHPHRATPAEVGWGGKAPNHLGRGIPVGEDPLAELPQVGGGEGGQTPQTPLQRYTKQMGGVGGGQTLKP